MNWLFQTKIFISYCSADCTWVEGLALQLKVAGFSVFVDKWFIKPGVPWRQQIEQALRECDAGIVVLSPEAIASGTVNSEIDVLFTKAWKEGRPFIPVLYKTCQMSEFLATMQYVDFRDTSEEGRAVALDSLIRGLRGQPPGHEHDATLPAAARKHYSLRLTLLVFLSIVMLGLAARGIAAFIGSNRSLAVLKRTQAQVQQVDAQVGTLTPPEMQNRRSSQWDYREQTTSERLATDWWDESGHLIRRRFYKSGRIIAEDTFEYSDQIPVRKVRQYFDDDQRKFLTDTFVSDGTLILKRNCPEFVEASCLDRVTEMVSPLPPASLMGYR